MSSATTAAQMVTNAMKKERAAAAEPDPEPEDAPVSEPVSEPEATSSQDSSYETVHHPQESSDDEDSWDGESSDTVSVKEQTTHPDAEPASAEGSDNDDGSSDTEDAEDSEDGRVNIDDLLFRGLDTAPLLALLKQPFEDAFYEEQTDMWGDIEAKVRDFLATSRSEVGYELLPILDRIAGPLDQAVWPRHQVLLGSAMDFVFAQPPAFVSDYLESWLLKACRGDGGSECAAQTLEQMLWSVRDALQTQSGPNGALKAALPVAQIPVPGAEPVSLSETEPGDDPRDAGPLGGGVRGQTRSARPARRARRYRTRRIDW